MRKRHVNQIIQSQKKIIFHVIQCWLVAKLQLW